MKTVRKRTAVLSVLLLIFVVILILPMQFPRSPRRSREAETRVEIARLEQALNSFRAKFGTRVPGSLQLPEDLSEVGAFDRTTLKRLWPMLDFQAQYDFNNDGDTDDAFQLNGAECLVFFLEGLRANETPTGFSKNPLRPFDPSLINRTNPFFEFESKRLTDVDSDGFFEYCDDLSQVPLIYVNSLPGSKPDVSVFPAEDHRNLDRPHTVNGAKKEVQIISAGQDGCYSKAGDYSTSNQEWNSPSRNDDITNFN